jgi:hypothetical protein
LSARLAVLLDVMNGRGKFHSHRTRHRGGRVELVRWCPQGRDPRWNSKMSGPCVYASQNLPISGGRGVKPAVQKAHNKWSVPCTFLRKLPRRATSRPEIEISDKRSAFSSHTPSIEPSYTPCQTGVFWTPGTESYILHAKYFQKTLHFLRNRHFYLFWGGFV